MPVISLVVPVRNEADNVAPVVAELRRTLEGRLDYEIVFVDDGSDDDTWQRLQALALTTPGLRRIRHREGCGQSAALWTGVRAARGRQIVTLDGDGQNNPADIPRLLDALTGATASGAVLVIGHRRRRDADRVRKVSSRLANGLRAWLLGDGVPDSGCGLKAFDRDAFLALPYFDHMHRFLPSLFIRAGGRTVSVPIDDRPRVHGVSKYGVHDRLWVGLVDLLGVLWLQARSRRPVIEDGPAVKVARPPVPRLAPDALGGWGLLWLLLVACALLARPLVPVDETRYVAVAWEMWLRGDFLVPHLNGQAYSDKPPLLFWTMHAGWWMFGVTEWWARLVAPLFGLGALWMTAALARALWPARPAVERLAPWLVLGSAVWAVGTTLTMFDTALTFCALLGLLGVVRAWGGAGRTGWPLVALAVGLGVLAKGPVLLLFVLPVALATPAWGGARRSWWPWYGALGAALVVGAIIALAWAVPAAQHGGAAYRDALLWSQTVERLATSFAHRRPVWWYLAVLPVALLPWSLWSRPWRAIRGRRLAGEPGVRFVLVWLGAAVAGLSLISGKQIHYVLPAVPAVALLLARIAVADTMQASSVVAAGRRLAMAAPALVVAANLVAAPVTGRAWDVAPLARRIGAWQESGHPVAHVGKYHGQFHFPGRLTRPLDVIETGTEDEWLRRHPGGAIVAYRDRGLAVPRGAIFLHPYRVKTAVMLGAAADGSEPDRPGG